MGDVSEIHAGTEQFLDRLRVLDRGKELVVVLFKVSGSVLAGESFLGVGALAVDGQRHRRQRQDERRSVAWSSVSFPGVFPPTAGLRRSAV